MSDRELYPPYVARKSCGCVVAACSAHPDFAEERVRVLRGWLRDGYEIERMPAEQVRTGKFGCTHTAKRPARLLEVAHD